MKPQLALIIALVTGVPFFPTSSLAQTRIEDLPLEDKIRISGEVRNVIGNTFVLNDGSGQVIVDAGPLWWREINISPGEQLTVTGEVDRREFEAFTIIRSDGSVVNIRPSQGPPPWAGQRGRNR